MKLELRNDIFFAEVERRINDGQSVTIPVKGFSMRPMMRSEKDKVILTVHSDNDIKQRAVMLFRHNGHHIMHRIVKIEGKRILLLDDIITTGATAGECARVLLTAGAKEVHCGLIAAARHHE